ncbi:MAG: hypothetical protein R2716_12710 [Microthrixaceae bacterium]
MQSRGTRSLRRVVLVLAVVLVAPIVPMPGFATEVVAAVERAPVESLRPADRSEVADLEAAVESAHEAAEAQPVQGDPDHGEGDGHDHEAIDPGQRLLGGWRPSGGVPDDRRRPRLDPLRRSPVGVRVREDDRLWGPWRELHLDPDEGPDLGSEEAGSGSVASEPVWVDRADAYEVSVAAGRGGRGGDHGAASRSARSSSTPPGQGPPPRRCRACTSAASGAHAPPRTHRPSPPR